MKLVFATNNLHKFDEIQKIADGKIILLNLKDIGCFEELPENQNTLEGNAREKAIYLYNKYKLNCFADDTGLEIEALDGKPGVFSARYAGEQKNSEDNISKVLAELHGETNRKARFRTVISLIIEGQEQLFEGAVNGIILHERKGKGGFGYDSVFQPDGYSCSFAEMTQDEKNKISHRKKAVEKLHGYLAIKCANYI